MYHKSSIITHKGSSPHARGTRFASCRAAVETGIIPACAGNTRPCLLSEPCGGDHPRMRGEHRLLCRGSSVTWGSSPHARGTLGRVLVDRARPGIIPACAGNTVSRSRMRSGMRDHPRMRGEHPTFFRAGFTVLGSSPHARGTPIPRRFRFECLGIIPACAGNTYFCSMSRRGHGDHPRMRGEHSPSGCA